MSDRVEHRAAGDEDDGPDSGRDVVLDLELLALNLVPAIADRDRLIPRSLTDFLR